MIHGIADRVGVRLSGQHDFQGFREAEMDRPKQFIPLHAGHDLIRNDNRQLGVSLCEFADHFQRFLAAFDGFDMI